MNLSYFAEQFAPDLLPLVPQLEARGAVLAGYGGGPQKPDDEDQLPHLDVLVDHPWQEEQWVTIYSADCCRWWDAGDLYQCTLQQFLAYLDQLPKPLHTFGRWIEEA